VVPGRGLIDQHETFASATSTLTQLKAEDRAPLPRVENLSTSSEIARIARQQYQLVVPGEQAFQVLPPAGTNGGATDPYSGDPRVVAPVSPSVAPELPPGSVANDQTTTTTHAKSRASDTPWRSPPTHDLISRLLHTLEFWR